MNKKYKYNSQISSINLNDSKVYNLQISEVSPDNFLKLTKKQINISIKDIGNNNQKVNGT